MATNWQSVPLGELIEKERGISYGIVQPGNPAPRGVPIIRVGDVRDGRISTSDPLLVAQSVEAAYSRTRLKGGELVMTLVGTVGETAVVPSAMSGWNTARAIAVIPVRTEIGAYWVSLALKAPDARQLIYSRQNTTVQATLNLRDVAQLPIILPPPAERKGIAHVLRTLDEKIELNRRMNETLEAMARAIFKDWFVDFGPTRAKAGRRAIHLEPGLSAHFPGEFADSEIGEIPKGWKVITLGRVCQVTVGGDWGEEGESSGAVRAACLRGVDLEHFRHDGFASPPNRWFKQKSIESRTMNECDVLIAASGAGPTGRPLWMNRRLLENLNSCTYSNFCKRVRCTSPADAVYVDAWLSEMRTSGEIWDFVNGTSVPNLDLGSLLNAKKIVQPPQAVVTAFHDFSRPIWEKKYHCENRSLVALRDLLLPKLISGKIRVKDAERIAEAAQ